LERSFLLSVNNNFQEEEEEDGRADLKRRRSRR
jgi:hypothetical protein